MRFFLLIVLFTSCSSTIQPTKVKGIAMTMPYQITFPTTLSENEKKVVQCTIDTVFKKIDQIFNRFNPQSEISLCNHTEKHFLSKELYSLLQKIDVIYQLSEKTFDPTIYTYYVAPQTKWGWEQIKRNNNQLITGNMQLDLSGIAKGYAIDLISDALQNLGYKNYLIDWSGDLLVKGSGYKKKGWTVELSVTKNTLQLSDMSIATSSALMPRSVQEMSTSHIVNVHNRSSITMQNHPIVAVSVVAPTCILADALATAAASFTDLKEAEKWAHRISEKNPGLAFYFVSENDAE